MGRGRGYESANDFRCQRCSASHQLIVMWLSVWVQLSSPLSLLRHLHLHSSVHQRFLSHSSSLSPSLSVCGEWRGTESCRKHYVKWPPGLKIHPLHRATLATAAAGGSSSQTAWHATKHIQHVHIRRSICQMPQRTRAYCINTHTYTHRYIYS